MPRDARDVRIVVDDFCANSVAPHHVEHDGQRQKRSRVDDGRRLLVRVCPEQVLRQQRGWKRKPCNSKEQKQIERYQAVILLVDQRKKSVPNAASRVDYSNNTRAPLLFIAGGKDHTVPASVNKVNLRKYINNSTAITEYREFPNRTHHTVGQAGWEEVADFAIPWASQHAIDQVTYDDVKSAFPPIPTSSTTRSPRLVPDRLTD